MRRLGKSWRVNNNCGLVDPRADRHRDRARARRHTLAAATKVVLVDGMLNKAAMWGQGMLDAAEQALRARAPHITFERESTNPLENRLSDEWAREHVGRCDAIVVAAGDCVTCTTRGVRDAIWSEVNDIPAVVVCTAAVVHVARDVCRAYGMPDLAVCPIAKSFFGLSRQQISDLSAAPVAGISTMVFQMAAGEFR